MRCARPTGYPGLKDPDFNPFVYCLINHILPTLPVDPPSWLSPAQLARISCIHIFYTNKVKTISQTQQLFCVKLQLYERSFGKEKGGSKRGHETLCIPNLSGSRNYKSPLQICKLSPTRTTIFTNRQNKGDVYLEAGYGILSPIFILFVQRT